MYIHGKNLQGKIDHRTKYVDKDSRAYLRQIHAKYEEWKAANEELFGPGTEPKKTDSKVLEKRTELLRQYKDFIDQKHFAEKFDARSNLHSSVIEEFVYYLFRDLVQGFGEHALIGKSHSFKDLFFVPPSYEAMLQRPYVQVERKDHDFVIGATVEATFRSRAPLPDHGDSEDDATIETPETGAVAVREVVAKPSEYDVVGVVDGGETLSFDVPAIAIECKTYLDKTMLEGSSRAADEIKARNPNGIYIVVCERLKLSGAVNLKKYAVDQIYVLRQERNIDREYRLLETYKGNPIATDVIVHLFNYVRAALTTEREVGLDIGIKRGWLL